MQTPYEGVRAALRQQASPETALTRASVELRTRVPLVLDRGQQVKGEFAPNLWKEGRTLGSVIRRAKIN